ITGLELAPVPTQNTPVILKRKTRLPNLVKYECAEQSIGIYDLETTGFGSEAELIQLAVLIQGRMFNRYIKPRNAIPRRITRLTGIEKIGNIMYAETCAVESVPLSVCLQELLIFLPTNSTLLAHNGNSFDNPRLTRAITQSNLDFSKKLDGMGDTKTVFKKVWPMLTSYKQADLAALKLPAESFRQHNAEEDVRILQLLFEQAMKENRIRTVTCHTLKSLQMRYC
ncbi:unnamed protein product, partial [Owenia fusiformis]